MIIQLENKVILIVIHLLLMAAINMVWIAADTTTSIKNKTIMD